MTRDRIGMFHVRLCGKPTSSTREEHLLKNMVLMTDLCNGITRHAAVKFSQTRDTRIRLTHHEIFGSKNERVDWREPEEQNNGSLAASLMGILSTMESNREASHAQTDRGEPLTNISMKSLHWPNQRFVLFHALSAECRSTDVEREGDPERGR